MRTFDSGATRDTDKGKLNYLKALSPLVLQRYVMYLDEHRLQSDGTYRDWDNWKQMFGEKHFDICLESALRHIIDVWKQHQGYEGQQSIESSLCGVLFNIQAYLFKILVDKERDDNGQS